MHKNASASKVFYRPLEAAIRWAGLLRYEQAILAATSSPRNLPDSLGCPRWEELRLCNERIYDGIINGELAFGKNGLTSNDISLLDSPDLTIRHIDLKRWMHTHYPEHRPSFLFCRSERIVHPFITVEAAHAMLVERLAMKVALERCHRQLNELQAQHDAILRHSNAPVCSPCSVSDRAEATYLHIIGGMLELMLGQSPAGVPYSCFRTQEAVVSALVAHHGGAMGIAERTLNGKFANARRRLRSATV